MLFYLNCLIYYFSQPPQQVYEQHSKGLDDSNALKLKQVSNMIYRERAKSQINATDDYVAVVHLAEELPFIYTNHHVHHHLLRFLFFYLRIYISLCT